MCYFCTFFTIPPEKSLIGQAFPYLPQETPVVTNVIYTYLIDKQKIKNRLDRLPPAVFPLTFTVHTSGAQNAGVPTRAKTFSPESILQGSHGFLRQGGPDPDVFDTYGFFQIPKLDIFGVIII